MKTKVLHVKVAGVTFDGRQEVISRLRGDEPVRIVPEPDNPHDCFALAVHVATADGKVEHVGYVPRQLAAEIAPALDGEAVMCEIDKITGGFETQWGEIANYGLQLIVEVPDTGGRTQPPVALAGWRTAFEDVKEEIPPPMPPPDEPGWTVHYRGGGIDPVGYVMLAGVFLIIVVLILLAGAR